MIPPGCNWVQDSVAAVDPAEQMVQCAGGRLLHYRQLILAPGLEIDHDELPGVNAAIAAENVASNYLNCAEKTWQLVRQMRDGGRAVFTVPRAPVSCTGTTLKPLLLAASYWARANRRVRSTLVIDRPGLTGVAALDDRLRERLDELGVETLSGTAVVGLHPDQAEISVGGTDGGVRKLGYDMLHLVPPFRGPRWLFDSGLAGNSSHGLIDIDPQTLRHRVHDAIWAAGDAAAVDTDPSGGALRRQIAVLVDNLTAVRAGRAATSTYDGYTVAPIAADTHRLIAAEFDRTGTPTSSLPSFLDPFTPRRTAWAFDRCGLPQIYWNLILKGRV